MIYKLRYSPKIADRIMPATYYRSVKFYNVINEFARLIILLRFISVAKFEKECLSLDRIKYLNE